MTPERFVVLALAEVRSPWPTDVARWCLGGELPIDFLPCVSGAELLVRVDEGQACSLVLLDGRVWSRQREVVAELERASIPIVVIDSDGRTGDGLERFDAFSCVPPTDAEQLEAVVRAHGVALRDVVATPQPETSMRATGWQAPLIAVTGCPGSGRSTLAIAVAQHLAAHPRFAQDVVLGDFARRAHLAILHDAGDIMPALPELMEVSRVGRPTREQVRELLFTVPERGYELLLGMRHPSDWATFRRDAVRHALAGLRTTTRLVIADVDADVSGEAETGSFDIEDRHTVARQVIGAADVVIATAAPTLTGLHGLAHIVQAHRAFGVTPEQQVVAFNRAPRSPRARHELTVAAQGACDPDGAGPVRTVVFIADRKSIELAHRDRTRLPDAIGRTLATFVTRHLDETSSSTHRTFDEPELMAAGSLGLTQPGPAT